jgi:hypothetical protein
MNEKINTIRKHIRKLVSEQINTDRRMVGELEQMNKSIQSLDKNYRALINNSFSRIVLDDGNGGKLFDVQLYPVVDSMDNCYDMRAYIHSANRIFRKGLGCDEVCDFIKDELKDLIDGDPTYIKNFNKGKRPYEKDGDYEYKPTALAEAKKKQKLQESVTMQCGRCGDYYGSDYEWEEAGYPKCGNCGGNYQAESDYDDYDESEYNEGKLTKSTNNIAEGKKKKEDKCDCDSTVGDMEEVKKTKRQEEFEGKDLEEVAFEELLPGIGLEELADKIENAVWGAIKRAGEEKHKKTAKADHDVKNLNADKHTTSAKKRQSAKTDKMKDKPKKHETSHKLKGKDSKVNTPKLKDLAKDSRKAEKTTYGVHPKNDKDEEYKPSKKSKK